VRLSVNMTVCDGRGLCAEVLPELITLDDWGFPIISGPVSPDLEDLAEEAVRLCPRLALRLTSSGERRGLAR
jgi:ferredoxin